MAIKYSLFCSWQEVKYLKTKLRAKSLRQIRGTNKVHAKPTLQNNEKKNCAECVDRENE